MNISFSGTLRIAGYEWPIINSGHEFCQYLGVRGAPASKVQAQGLWILLDGSGSDTRFFTDLLLATPRPTAQSGHATYHNADGQTLRQVEFEEGYVVAHHTVFEPGRADGLPALLELVHIKAPVWYVDGQRHPFLPEAPARERPPVGQDKPSPPDLKCQVVFSRKTIYDGDFGFDWLQWKKGTDTIEQVQDTDIANFEYAFDEATHTYQAVKTHPALLDKVRREYTRLSVYGKPYFAPWLAMQPGQTITLLMTTQFLNSEALRQDYLTFAPNAAYEVTVNGQTNEAIRLTPADNSAISISIKCLRAGPATKLLVKDELGTTVGQISVVENQYKYKLPLRVAYMAREGATKAAELQALQAKVKAHLPTLTTYLNTKSFNQAFIECSFEQPAKPHVVTFDPKQWAKEGYYNPATNELKDKNGNESLLSYVSQKVSTLPAFRGVTIFMTSLEFEDNNPNGFIYGFGQISPSASSNLVLFSQGITGTRTFAHEMGHVLGLRHSFLDSDTKQRIAALGPYKANIKKLITLQQGLVKTMTGNIKKMKSIGQDSRQEEANLRDQKKYLSSSEQSLAAVEDELRTYAKNKLLFTKGSSENIMDYYNQDRSFWHWQWALMQTDTINFYGSKVANK
ncbi:type VI secretion system tube protein TssD [Hymenobacter lucidus]|uniref:Peptidase M43 pregnancy-associated plasma-A domain-containing protein n=1 Tax=Hymenobacter lucidus TaxID=2880930 RepID=A0ABS8ATH0_9BACT|nr:type VI secretion system tube protein TssD [Hymenobacter lucidus]MCB2409512.1 hypothetical protein [Hymenobacter lucidus]